MDIFEFELRFHSFRGLSNRLKLDYSDDLIIKLVKRTNEGQIQKKLIEVTPTQLHTKTQETYTDFKKDYLAKTQDKIINKDISLADYIERLEYELKIIKEMGYNTYFLIVRDYILWARDNDIPVGPGRGSAAGCLLSYLVRITDINPMEYGLIFERFLNPARVTMPDIDTDFDDTQREKIIEYCKNKYGTSKVSLIGTYMTMAAKAAFKDVARSHGMDFSRANEISKFIEQDTVLESVEANDQFASMVENNNELKNMVQKANKLQGTIRQIGVHACGVIIAPDDVVNYTPVLYPPEGGGKDTRDTSRVVSQYDGHVLEDIGLLKMDFLGLRNLSIIKNTIKIIRARHELQDKKLPDMFQKYFDTMSFDPPLDDSKTYKETFQKGNTSGVFQFESDGMRRWLEKLKPDTIEDIIAMVALYRPGPMDFIPDYIDIKHGKKEIQYMPDEVYTSLVKKYDKQTANKEAKQMRKDLEGFMDRTYGIPIYQEQLMRIVQSMAGFSLGEADLLRRGVGKKIKEIVDKLKGEFISRAKDYKGYKKETCEYVYDKMIAPAADYSFNKSHAACYAYIAYQTAYLKANYTIEFQASLLRSVEEDTDKLQQFIDEMKVQGLKVLPPSVNKSFAHVAAIKDTIRIGFLAIKGIGSGVAEDIEAEIKQNGKYSSLEDFLKRNRENINKKTVQALTKSGALDSLADRKTILENLQQVLDYAQMSGQMNQSNSLFSTNDLDTDLKFKQEYETTRMERLHMEHEKFKTFVSGHFFDGIYNYVKKKYNFISMFQDQKNYGKFKILGFIKDIRRVYKKGFFIVIEDISGQIDLFLENKVDFKRFDVIALRGYKQYGRVNISNIVKIDLEELIKKIKEAGKYDDNKTVMNIRNKRFLAEQKKKKDQKKSQKQKKKKEKKNQDQKSKSAKKQLSFDLPDDISIIKQIMKIIKNNSGDQKVQLDDENYFLSKEGISKIKNILNKSQ